VYNHLTFVQQTEPDCCKTY